MTIRRQRSKAGINNEFTNLVSGEEVTKENPRNTYRFEIHTYFGDADAYETLNLLLKSKSKAIEFANFLKNQMAVAYPNGRGGGDEYNYKNSPDVPDWEKWFGDGYEEDEKTGEYKKVSNPEFPEVWPSNWEYWGEASYDYANIFYFDEEGREYAVQAV